MPKKNYLLDKSGQIVLLYHIDKNYEKKTLNNCLHVPATKKIKYIGKIKNFFVMNFVNDVKLSKLSNIAVSEYQCKVGVLLVKDIII